MVASDTDRTGRHLQKASGDQGNAKATPMYGLIVAHTRDVVGPLSGNLSENCRSFGFVLTVADGLSSLSEGFEPPFRTDHHPRHQPRYEIPSLCE